LLLPEAAMDNQANSTGWLVMAGALDGITVVEFSSNLSAAFAAMLLAEHGAHAILIGPAERAARLSAPHPQVFDRSKRRIAMDFAAAEYPTTARRLIASADVVITGDTPARRKQLGLDYESIRAVNSSTIGLYLPPFGSAGTLAEMEGGEELAAALSGVTGSQWARSGNPVATIFPVVSYATGVLGATAAVAALLARRSSGRGQAVEVPMIAGGLALQTGAALRHPAMRPLHPTEGSQNPLGPIPCYRVFEAADGRYLFIACGNQTFWNRFTLAIERPDLVADARFEHAPWGMSTENREALRQILEPIIHTRPMAEWLEILRENDVPCAPIVSRTEFFDTPQVRYMDARQQVADSILGTTAEIAAPVRLSATPGGIRSEASLDGHPTVSPLATDPSSSMSDADAPPLAGVLVLDFSSYIAGSFCGMLLAQLGAEVIKIESLQGDSFRSMEFAFLGWNQGKRSLALNLNRAEGRELAKRLAERGDIVLENMRPGRMHRFGLDYESLAEKNRRLIYMTITGYGSRGPEHNQPGFDPLLQARSGMMAAQGGPHGAPVYLTCSPCDYGAAMLATLGCVLALHARNRDGRGQFCETSLLQAAVAFQAGELVFYDGRHDLENGSAEYRGAAALSRAYQCADGRWLFVTIKGGPEWRRLCGLLGIDSGVDYPAAAAAPAEGALASRLAERFAAHDREPLLATLREAGIAAVAVNRVNDLFADPQIAANDLFAAIDHPGRGPVTEAGLLMKFATTPGVLRRPAPAHGEHSETVLGELLGIDSERIRQLREQGVLGA
jgi:crotonobetainyl-CoA:carnitine CoA-transferase CaiB-like acyl-CoA transferase